MEVVQIVEEDGGEVENSHWQPHREIGFGFGLEVVTRRFLLKFSRKELETTAAREGGLEHLSMSWLN